MPLPVGHSLLGAAMGAAADRDAAPLSASRLLLAAAIANAPDLDYLPGMLIGNPHRFHRMATHSLGAVVIVGLLAALLVRLGWLRPWPLRRGWPAGAVGTGLIVSLLWASHLFLDALNADYSHPVGQMLLWPLSAAWIPGLFPLFLNIDKVAGPATAQAFVASLVTWHNVKAVLLESAVLGPVFGLAVWLRRRSGRAAP